MGEEDYSTGRAGKGPLREVTPEHQCECKDKPAMQKAGGQALQAEGTAGSKDLTLHG